MMKNRKLDLTFGLLFLLLTITFIVVSMTNETFFRWAFDRHHNQWSWYIRPLFIIPFCFFAFKRSWTGMFFTVFCLFTSMFWFPKPTIVDPQAAEFLTFEQDWLYGEWDLNKILITLLIPISFALLAFAFWKRSLFFGLGVVVMIAITKLGWSYYFGGESGKSILVPALIGLFVCISLIYIGFRRLDKN